MPHWSCLFPPSPRPFLNQALPKSRLEFRNLKLCLSPGEAHQILRHEQKYSHTDPKGRPKHPPKPSLYKPCLWGMLRKQTSKSYPWVSNTTCVPSKTATSKCHTGFRAPKCVPSRIPEIEPFLWMLFRRLEGLWTSSTLVPVGSLAFLLEMNWSHRAMEEQITSVIEEPEFYVFNAVPFKIPLMGFVEIGKLILKSQGMLNNQKNL